MQSITRTSETSKILDSILAEDAELKKAVEKVSDEIKIAGPIMVLADNLTITAMSKEEIKENLKKLSDPDVAKEVAKALKSAVAGEEVKIAKLPAGVGPIIMALMAFLGTNFAQDNALKADFSKALELKKIELPDVNTFKQNLEKTDEFINALNDVIKSKEGRDVPGFASATIGGKKLTARNKNQADMLAEMAKIDGAMKANVSKGFMSDKTYKEKIDKMVKAFETMRPVKL